MKSSENVPRTSPFVDIFSERGIVTFMEILGIIFAIILGLVLLDTLTTPASANVPPLTDADPMFYD
jgi:hypothetical protein